MIFVPAALSVTSELVIVVEEMHGLNPLIPVLTLVKIPPVVEIPPVTIPFPVD